MVRKHITRDYSNHEKSIIRVDDEYIKFECFSYDPSFEKIYLAEQNNLTGDNIEKTSWKRWTCFRSKDKVSDMCFKIPYSVLENGDYQIDFVYEQYSRMYSGKDDLHYNDGKDLTGSYNIVNVDSNIISGNVKAVSGGVSKISDVGVEKSLLFDGENNVLKRQTVYESLNQGNYTIYLYVPHNIYFYGVVIRKIKRFWGTNTDEAGSNLQFTQASLSLSDMIKPSELQVTVGYDDDFECNDSPSGFYMDYMNECNLYVKDNSGQIERVFGGYLSSILPDDDRTTLTIHCADRLVDSQNTYILDYLSLNGGDSNTLADNEFVEGMEHDFKSYGELLKYLCDVFETTLKSNINANYLVDGEKFSDSVVLSWGKNKQIKKVTVSNALATMNKNSVTLRNKPSAKKSQTITLYEPTGKVPQSITGMNYMYLTIGLGNPKTESKSTSTVGVDNSSIMAGSQKFGKCGQSADKKYVMAIGKPSASTSDAKKKGLSSNQLYKTIFENKCPHCKNATLRWDSARSDTKCIYTAKWKGTKKKWGIPETEITCNHCDADYDAVTGLEKDKKHSTRLKMVGSRVKSSKAEQDKLHNGEMYAVPTTNVSATADDIFDSIWAEGKKYTYASNTYTTYKDLQLNKKGDCWAFADFIFTRLKQYKVNCKIINYKTSASNNHRSVMYQNTKGQWVDYPYNKHNWNRNVKAYSHNTYKKIKSYTNGGTIAQAKISKSTTKQQTTTITTTQGYDKDNPIQGYFDIIYSLEKSFNAKKYHLYLDFTQKSGKTNSWSGLNPVWVNNNTRKLKFDKLNAIFKQNHGENTPIYLQGIKFIAPKKVATSNEDKVEWYTNNATTHDNSSCKMLLYQIIFNNQNEAPSKGLDSCGKSINDLLNLAVSEADYLVDMTYGLHRKDDVINFRVNNNTSPVFTAHEGDKNNILDWSNISYSPVGDLHNLSICVFKDYDNSYNYVDTGDPTSIMKYHAQTCIETSNEPISAKEAYFNARMSDKFNSVQTYTFTIITPNYPDLRLGDLVQVIANAKKLNTIKEVESIKITYDNGKIPRIRTELGLGELAPDIQMKQNIRQLRQEAKKETTSFSASAVPVNDKDIYVWDN